MKFPSGHFYGKISNTLATADFGLMETLYSPTVRLPDHSHELAYFCFVIEGSFTEVYGRRSRSCRPSTLVFHPAGETHSDHFHTGARCFNIEMNLQWLERARQYSKVLSAPTDFRDGRISVLASRLYSEFRDRDDLSLLAIEGLMLELLVETSRRSVGKLEPKPPRWLRQVREMLDGKIDDRPTLAALSESVGVHPVHLAREFRRFYRCTIGEYLRKRRVSDACRRISTTNAPLTEIALAVGFFDQSHFARTFKKIMGLTPNEYRRAFHR